MRARMGHAGMLKHLSMMLPPRHDAPAMASLPTTAAACHAHPVLPRTLPVCLMYSLAALQAVQEWSGCTSLAGAALESEGGEGTQGEHWEMLYFPVSAAPPTRCHPPTPRGAVLVLHTALVQCVLGVASGRSLGAVAAKADVL